MVLTVSNVVPSTWMLELNIKNVYFKKGNKLSHTGNMFTEVDIQI